MGWKSSIRPAIFVLIVAYLFIDVGSGDMFASYTLMSRPEFWPRVMLVGLLITGMLKFLVSSRLVHSRQTKKNLLRHLLVPKVIISIIIVAIYCYSTQYVGFALGTMIFISAYMWFLGVRKMRPLLLTPIVSTIIILLVFWRFLYVAVPKGYGVFLSFSNFVMAIVRIGTT